MFAIFAILLVSCFRLAKLSLAPNQSSIIVFQFTQPIYLASIWENYNRKTYIHSSSKMGVPICDSCEGVVRFHIISGDANGLFRAESLTIGNFAYLRVHTRPSFDRRLNREQTDKIELDVRATLRKRKLETSARIIIEVKDENDSPPIFPIAKYDVTVRQDTPPFSAVAKVQATDADQGLNAEICYYLLRSNAYFAVNPSTGVVSLVRPMPRGYGRNFTLEIVAEDRTSRLFPEQRSAIKPNTAVVQVSVVAVEEALSRLSCKAIPGRGCTLHSRLCALCHFDTPTKLSELTFRLVGAMAEYFAVLSNESHGVVELWMNHVATPPASYKFLLEAYSFGRLIGNGSVSLSTAIHCNPAIQNGTYSLNFTTKWRAPVNTALGLVGPSELADLYLFRWHAENAEPWAVDAISGLLFLRHALDENKRERYSFPVVAHSTACHVRFTYDVSVFVEEFSDPWPTFSLPPNCRVNYLDQHVPADSTLCKLSSSSWSDDGSTFAIVQRDEYANLFRVDNGTGELFLVADVAQLEGVRSISVTVRLSKDHLHSDLVLNFPLGSTLHNASVHYELVKGGANDHQPLFKRLPFGKISVFENATVGTKVFQADAVDADVGAAGELSYFIEAGNEDGRWMMDARSGLLSIGRPLDRERRQLYRLKLAAQDGGEPWKKANATLTIEVLDSNDNKPTFQKFIHRAEVEEGSSYGYEVLRLSASDRDVGINGQITYHLVSKSRHFGLDAVNGTLLVRAELDRELTAHHELVVQAVDAGWPTLSSFALVHVKVLDVNDNAPVCLQPLQRVEIFKDTPPHCLITCVHAHDADLAENARLGFRLLTNQSVAPFEIDQDTGCVRTSSELGHLVDAAYNLTILVHDHGAPALETLCSLEVVVLTVGKNRYPPEFESVAFEASVYENQPAGTSVLKLNVTDRDAAARPELVFSLIGGDGINAFVLDQDGAIRTRVSLDRERKANYWLTVRATDLEPVQQSATADVFVVVKDRNDNPPVPDRPIYYAQVVENCPANTLILQMDATDLDEDSYPLKFEIAGGNIQGLFNVHVESGQLFSTGRKIDREAYDSHQLEIEIKDSGTPFMSTKVLVVLEVVDENDNAPQFLVKSSRIVVPACRQPDERVYRVFAFDQDAGLNGAVRYAVLNPQQSLLRVDQVTGEIFCRQPVDGDSDVEMTLQAYDLGTPRLSSQVEIVFHFLPLLSEPTNRPPEIVEKFRTVHVPATWEPAADLAIVEAVDADDDDLWFYLKDNQIDDVALIANTGALKVSKLPTWSQRNVSYIVTDGFHSVDGTVALVYQHRTYTRPRFDEEKYYASVYENASIGTVVFSMRNHLVEKEARHLTFSLAGPRSNFAIDANSGDVVVAEALDRESQSNHLIMVEAHNFSLKTCAFLMVTVLNVNDHPPRFLRTYTEVSLPPAAPVGFPVAHLIAYDADLNGNGGLTYSLMAESKCDIFQIDPANGDVTLVKSVPLDVTECILIGKVTDHGLPSLSSNAKLRVTISTNESLLQFASKESYVQLRRDTPIGAPVALVQAKGGSYVRYRLNDSTETFQVNALTGCVTLKRPLDVGQSGYDVQLIARDASGGQDWTRVLVSLEPRVVKGPPLFQDSTYSANVDENCTNCTVMIQDSANTPLVLNVLPLSRRHVLTIVENWARDLFSIDPFTGSLRTRGPIDHEHVDRLAFHVMAADVEDDTLETKYPASLVIRVNNVNDNAPHFAQSAMEVHLLLPTVVGMSVVAKLKAYDADGDQLTFSIYEKQHLFTVHPTRGVLILNREVTLPQTSTLTLRVTDGAHEAQAKVVVKFVDNAASPLRCAQEVTNVWLMENFRSSKVLTKVMAIGNQSAAVSFSLLNARDDFGVNHLSGAVYYNGFGLDREAEEVVNLLLRIDADHNAAHCIVRVNVQDANDCTPTFLNLPYREVIARNAKVGSLVGRVRAVDFDSGANGRVEYIFDNTFVAHSRFHLNRTTGLVTLKTGLPDDQRSVALRIIATDHGHPPLMASTMMLVDIVDVDVKNPTVKCNASIFEGSKSFNAPVTRLNGTGSTYFTIVDGNVNDHFVVSERSGTVSVQKPLDREARAFYQLIVKAENELASLNEMIVLDVAVLDVNDNAPVFSKSIYYATLKENVPVGGLVLTLNATDADQGVNGQVRFYLAQSDDSPFQLEHVSGALSLRDALDFEVTQAYRIQVQCRDLGNPELSGWAYVHVEVEDVNDNAPVFDRSSYFVPLAANLPVGQMVGKFSAHDADLVDQGGLRYSLHNDGDRLFSLDPREAVLMLNRSLREVNSTEYKLQLVVDDGLFSNACTLHVKIVPALELRPSYAERSKVLTLAESTAVGLTVTSVRLPAVTGNVRYESLLGDVKKFSVESDSGLISLAESLDYEEATSHRLVVGAITDEGVVSVIRLDVNVVDQTDHPPRFVASKYKITLSSVDLPGARVLQFCAVDKDKLDKMEYHLAAKGQRMQNALSHFSLESSTGVFSLRKSLKNLVGRELKFTVVATDQSNPPLRDEASLVVYVSPHLAGRPITPLFVEMKVSESAPVGTAFGRVRHTDYSTTHAVMVPPVDQYIADVLTVSVNGTISVSQPLDREHRSELRFYVALVDQAADVARDNGYLSMILVIVNILDVNDNAPNFGARSLLLTLPEDIPIGHHVVSLNAVDRDEGINGFLTYTLTEEGSDEGLPFSIRDAWLVTSHLLNYETRKTYNLQVLAVDGGVPPLNSSLYVQIDILAINRRAPVFEREVYQFLLQPNALHNVPIGSVRAVDADAYASAPLQYNIIRGNSADIFRLSCGDNGQPCLLYLSDTFKKSKWLISPIHELTVHVSDGKFTDSALVRINFTIESEDTCHCEEEVIYTSVPEDAAVGSIVYNFTKTEATNGTVRGCEKFKVSSGSLQLVDQLNWEEVPSCHLYASYEKVNCDHACPVTFVIKVLDRNDNAPIFSQSSYHSSIPEHLDVVYPKRLVQVHAVDYDSGLAGSVVYKFLDTSSSNLFEIDQYNGVIYVKQPLDREEKAEYELKIVAEDRVSPPLSSVAIFNLEVLDINDNPPTFTRSQYTASVLESSPIGHEILTVNALSLDEGLNAKISYRLERSPASPVLPFTVDSETGKLTTNETLNVAVSAAYDFTVVAQDMGQPPLSGQASVQISIIDVNDHSPKFAHKKYQLTLLENSAVGKALAHLSADDEDIGDNGKVGYRLISSEQIVHQMFAINQTGWLLLTQSPDREEISNLQFKLEAYDFGIPSRSSFLDVQVEIVDVNDNAPKVDKCNDTLYVKRPFKVGSLVHEFHVTDTDSSEPGAFFHFTLDKSSAANFQLSPEGRLKVAQANLTEPYYVLNVMVSDGELTTDCHVTVHLVEESKHPPELGEHSVDIWTYVGEFPAHVIGQLRATDKDPMDELEYGIQSSPFAQPGTVTLNSDNGVLFANGELPVGSYAMNISVTDKKFTSYGVVIVEVQSVTEKMLQSSVTIRLTGLNLDKFVAYGVKALRKSLSKQLRVKQRFIQLFSLDPSQPDGLDVHLAFQKDKHHFHSPAFVRERLERGVKDLALDIGCQGVKLLQEQCSSGPCLHGGVCKEIKLVDEQLISSVKSSMYTMHGPKIVSGFECACRPGFGGQRCQTATNPCSSNPCSSNALCIPNNLQPTTGYTCQCYPNAQIDNCTPTCHKSACNSIAISFSGNAFVRYALEQSIEVQMNLTLRLRTKAQWGVLVFSKGRKDFHCLELNNGFLRYRFDLGSGQTIVPSRAYVADNAWHSVVLLRHAKNATLLVDDSSRMEMQAFGSGVVLNLNRASHVFLGGEVAQSDGLNAVVKSGFVGCVRSVTVNGQELSIFDREQERRALNVRLNCHDESGQSSCETSPCQNGAACSVKFGQVFCACPEGFFGKFCEISNHPCVPNKCLNGGSCYENVGRFQCKCKAGYTGASCERALEYSDHCAEHQCANDARCVGKVDGTYICNCSTGWSGLYCDVPTLHNPNMATDSRLGITLQELVTVLVVAITVAALLVAFVIFCRRRRRIRYEKVRLKRTKNEEILLDHPYINRQGNHVYRGGADPPPPLPPRFQSFHGRKQAPACFSSKPVHLPTAQVRPLSFLDRSQSSSSCALQTAVNYGSAAEELDQCEHQSQKGEEDWKAVLNKLDADSLGRLKVLAGIEDDDEGSQLLKTEEKRTAGASFAEPSSSQWDYSEWNSTLGNTGYPSFVRARSNENVESGTLPYTICSLEDTDYEYANRSSSDSNGTSCSNIDKKAS